MLGAFAYGSALTLSLRRANPVWAPHRSRGTGSTAPARPGQHRALCLVGRLVRGAGVRSVLRHRQWHRHARLARPAAAHARAGISAAHHAHDVPGSARRRLDGPKPHLGHRIMHAAYVVAPLAALGALAIVFDVIDVPNANAWVGGAIAALFARGRRVFGGRDAPQSRAGRPARPEQPAPCVERPLPVPDGDEPRARLHRAARGARSACSAG